MTKKWVVQKIVKIGLKLNIVSVTMRDWLYQSNKF